MSSQDTSTGASESYFARPPLLLSSLQTTPEDEDDGEGEHSEQPSKIPTRRNACTLCRKRKLRCDGSLPACATCVRLKHDCIYVESRRKSGPRRGYVKGLETRLAQVEELLAQYESKSKAPAPTIQPDISSKSLPQMDDDFSFMSAAPDMSYENPLPEFQADFNVPIAGNETTFLPEELSWSMIELGLEEPLPPQDAIDELTMIYFAKIHLNIPIIHQYRFLAAMNLSGEARPQVSLRYAMWALAASITDKYRSYHPYFYSRARRYIERDETARRQKYINLRHAQAFILVGMYEFKHCLFPNTTLTSSRAVCLTQMLNFHRIDGLGLDIKQTLSKPSDMGEKEERRRTFWMAFAMDIHSSVGTGWPTIVDERDILTNLPCSEEKFEASEEGPSITLKDAMNPRNASSLSSFGGRILVSSLMGKIFHHLHRPSASTDPEEVSKQFWKSHREIDNTLLNMSLFLPPHLRLPFGISDTNIVYLNMSLHGAVICLHQAAIFKAEKLPGGEALVAESKGRCFSSATGITSIMKQIAHLDLTALSIFTPFSLYLSTRIFAQASKADPSNETARSEQRFLLSALLALRDNNPLVDSYLVQLDLEGIGMSSLQENMQAYTDLEKDMASISVNEHNEETSWMTFVSPLVRIVERTEDSSVSPATQVLSGLRESSSESPEKVDKGKEPELIWGGLSIDAAANSEAQHQFSENIGQEWVPGEGEEMSHVFDEMLGFRGQD